MTWAVCLHATLEKLRTLTLAVAAVLGMAIAAEAGQLTLAWDASPDPDVIGYVVLFGTQQGFYPQVLDVGNETTATVRNLANGQTYYFTVVAYSSNGRLSEVSNDVSGTAVNLAPAITPPTNQLDAEGESISLDIAASDPDGDPLTFSANGLPSGLTIHPQTGVISGTLAYDTADTHTVTITVTDGSQSDNESFTWTVTNTNVAPLIVAVPRSNPVGAVIVYAISANDFDGDQTSFDATNLPPGLTVDPATGIVTGTLTTAGIYTVTVSVNDTFTTTFQDFVWTVLETNVAPSLANPGNQEGSVVNPLEIQLYAEDADGNTLTFGATGLPPGLSLDSRTGLIAGQPLTAGLYPDVAVSASDGLATSSHTFTWTIHPNRAPVITPIGNTQSLEFEPILFAVEASDPEFSDVTFSASGLPPELVINQFNGEISGLPTTPGAYPVTVFASDGTLTASHSFTWTIAENEAPTIQNPGNQSAKEFAWQSVHLTAIDPDANATLYFSASNLPPGLTVDELSGEIFGLPTIVGTYSVTVTVSDGAASDSESFQWEILPNPAPTIVNPGPQAAVVGTPVFLYLDASDPNGDPFTLVAHALPPGLTLDPVLKIIKGTPTAAGTFADARVTAYDGTHFTVAAFAWTVTAGTPRFSAVQANRNAPGGSAQTVQVVFESAQLATDLNVVAVGWYDTTASIVSVDDSRGNIYLPALAAQSVPGVATQQIYYAKYIGASAAGANTVTVTFDTPATAPDVRIVEYAGAKYVMPVDATAGAHGSGLVADSGSLTTSRTTELLVAANLAALDRTTTPAAGYTVRGPASQTSFLADRIVTAAGTYNATAAIDPAGDWIMQLVAFRARNVAPSLATIPNELSLEDKQIAIFPIAIDPDGDPLTWTAQHLPNSLGMNDQTGVISGHLEFDSAGVHTVTVQVSDGEATTTQNFTWTVENVNRPPTMTEIANQVNAEGDGVVGIQVFGSDPDLDQMTFTATGLPDGLSIGTMTGSISGVVAFDAAGTHSVTVTASDGFGGSASRSFTWTISGVNRAPTVTTIPAQQGREGASISLQVVASDPDDTPLTYTAVGLPDALGINQTTGAITGTLGLTSQGAYPVTVTVSDGFLEDETSFTWTVAHNGAPVLSPLGNLSTTSGAGVSIASAATDPDSDELEFSATGLPNGVTLDADTGVVTGAPGITGTFAVTITATDSILSASASFEWKVAAPETGERVVFVQASSSPQISDVAAVTVPYPVAQHAGSLDVVVVGWDGPSADVQSIVDTKGNVYQLAVGPTTRPDLGSQAIYYAANVLAAAPGVNHVTVTFTAPVAETEVRIVEYEGIEPENVVDATADAEGVAGEADSGTASTTFKNDFIFGATWVAAESSAPEDGFTTRLTTASGTLLADRRVSALGSYSVKAAVAPPSAWIAQLVAFRVLNHAPTLNNPGNQLSLAGISLGVPLLGSDVDNDPLTYGVTGLPPGLALSPNGLISGVVAIANAGVYNVTASVSDGLATTNVEFSWTIAAPAISATSATLVAGGSMTFTWSGISAPTATDWVALVPVGAGDTAYAAFWFTTGVTSGSRTITLPSALASGAYELRLFAQNSLVRLAVSGVVTVEGLALTATPGSIGKGGTLLVSWAGIGTPTASDWLAVVAPGASDHAYVAWAYSTGTSSGTKGITLPESVPPGTYEVRAFANDSFRRIAVSNTFNLTATTVTASPSTVLPGGTVVANWAGIGAPTATDWVALIPSGSSDAGYVLWKYTSGAGDGSRSLVLPASIAPGTYEVRLFARDTMKRLAVSNTITVAAATITATPSTVAPGGTLTVAWKDVGFPKVLDWIGLVPVGAPDGGWVAWINATGRNDDSTLFMLPTSLPEGAYTVRLFANNTLNRLAISDAFTVTAPGPSVSASPTSVAPGGKLTFGWRDVPTPSTTDWVGLYQSEAADEAFVTKIYTNGRATDMAVSTLPADLSPGIYELRLFDDDTFTRLAVGNAFRVTGGASLRVNAPTVAAGSQLTLTWEGIASPTPTDWLALVPINGLDSNYVSWRYTTGSVSGTVGLPVPSGVPPGFYQLRLYANDGLQRLAVSNTVVVGTTLSVSPSTLAAGATMTISWSGITAPTATDWLAFVPVNDPDANVVAWTYTSGRAADTVTFTLPLLPPGQYDVRLFRGDSVVRLATSNVLTIASDAVTLSVTPAVVGAGAALDVQWTGIATPTAGDWIGVYAAGAEDGGYVTRVFTSGAAAGSTMIGLPDDLAPGSYELRLFANDTFTRLGLSNGVTVVTGPVVRSTPATIAAGGTLPVSWEAIGAATATDWVALVPVNGTNQSYVAWGFTSGTAAGSLNLAIPASVPAGKYELRLFGHNTFTRLATGNVVTVTP